MPPGTGDAQLSLVQATQVDGAIIVTTPQEVSVGDALRGVKMFERVGVPVLGIVENMSWFECPHCGKPIARCSARGGGERLAKAVGPAAARAGAAVSARDGGRRHGRADRRSPTRSRRPRGRLTAIADQRRVQLAGAAPRRLTPRRARRYRRLASTRAARGLAPVAVTSEWEASASRRRPAAARRSRASRCRRWRRRC